MRKGLLTGLAMLLMIGSSGYANENPFPLPEPDLDDCLICCLSDGECPGCNCDEIWRRP